MAASLARFALALTALVAGLGASNRAEAAPFAVAGFFSIEIVGLNQVSLYGQGVANVNGSSGGAHLNTLALPAGVFENLTSPLVVPADTADFPLVAVQLTVSNQAGAIHAGAGAIPLAGFAKVCLFDECPAAVANVNVPLSVVGVGGVAIVGGAEPVQVTVIGAPWTTGTAVIGTVTRMGFAHGPGSNASSTAQASGQIQLVTPIFISTNQSPIAVMPAFAFLSLHFVPEPGTIALVGGGIVLLATAGRARIRCDLRTRAVRGDS
jgi:hypothetical protein